MTLENLTEENRTLKKKLKNLKRKKLKLKNNMNKIILQLKNKLEQYEINNNWETLNVENN